MSHLTSRVLYTSIVAPNPQPSILSNVRVAWTAWAEVGSPPGSYRGPLLAGAGLGSPSGGQIRVNIQFGPSSQHPLTCGTVQCTTHVVLCSGAFYPPKSWFSTRQTILRGVSRWLTGGCFKTPRRDSEVGGGLPVDAAFCSI